MPAVPGNHLFFELRGMVDCRRVNTLSVISRDCPQPFWHEQATGHALQVWSLSFLVSRWGWNCAPNSGVEHVSHPEGCDLNAEGLWALSRILHALWMHHFMNCCFWIFTKPDSSCHVSWSLAKLSGVHVELRLVSSIFFVTSTSSTSWTILWRWYDEPAVTSSVSSSDSGATCSSQGAKLHFESTTCVTSSNPYPASPTTSSSPPILIHSTSTSVYTTSTGTTNTGGTSIHTTWIQRILQRRGDDAADEEHGRIQHAGFRGQEPRAQQESSSNSCTTTNSSLSTNSKPSSPIRWSSTTTTTFPSSLSFSLSPASFSTGQTSNLCPTKSTSSKIAQTNTSFVSATLVTQETTFHIEKLFETSKQSCLGHITVSLSTSTRRTTW